MPRRSAPRCRRRGPTDGSGTLPSPVECCLVWGSFFGMEDWELRSIGDYQIHWRRWGGEITSRWIEGVPGSRPFACYLLGEIPPPAWQNEKPILRHPLRRIVGCTIMVPDTSWHMRAPELEHLVALGLVDDQEHEAALARIAGPPWRDNYRWISHEHEDRLGMVDVG